MITGDENTIYEEYVHEKYLKDRQGLKLLSLGSGSCSHEIIFAGHDCFSQVSCVDMAGNLLEKGRRRSRELGLKNMEFVQGDVHYLDLKENGYDVILFHASLHHFRDVERLTRAVLLKALKEDGLLLINEYVGPDRMQFPQKQIRAVNRALGMLPDNYRVRYKLKLRKNRVSGPGILRMLMADPSEARESGRILDTLDKYMEALEINPYGGNILMLALKDIAHHFLAETDESNALLDKLFELEDEYLSTAKSDFVFAVYKKKE
jgi:ubiquinone/menaquinone biosynthesis C-methylase UbiE